MIEVTDRIYPEVLDEINEIADKDEERALACLDLYDCWLMNSTDLPPTLEQFDQ